jgi:hypothetical protein
MNHYWICGIGTFIGTFLGLLVAALLGAAHKGDRDQELVMAYQDGFEAGQRSQAPIPWDGAQTPHRSV